MAGRPPFSRQRDRGGERSEWTVIRAAEFVASAYGWGPDYIDNRLTDEQLVAYLDAAQERLTEEGRGRFTEAVEAVRAGTIFAHEAKQYDRWRADVARRTGQRQPGKNLSQLARDLGAEIGGVAVERGGLEFRN